MKIITFQVLGLLGDPQVSADVVRDYNKEWETPENVCGGRKQEHSGENPGEPLHLKIEEWTDKTYKTEKE